MVITTETTFIYNYETAVEWLHNHGVDDVDGFAEYLTEECETHQELVMELDVAEKLSDIHQEAYEELDSAIQQLLHVCEKCEFAELLDKVKALGDTLSSVDATVNNAKIDL